VLKASANAIRARYLLLESALRRSYKRVTVLCDLLLRRRCASERGVRRYTTRWKTARDKHDDKERTTSCVPCRLRKVKNRPLRNLINVDASITKRTTGMYSYNSSSVLRSISKYLLFITE